VTIVLHPVNAPKFAIVPGVGLYVDIPLYLDILRAEDLSPITRGDCNAKFFLKVNLFNSEMRPDGTMGDAAFNCMQEFDSLTI